MDPVDILKVIGTAVLPISELRGAIPLAIRWQAVTRSPPIRPGKCAPRSDRPGVVTQHPRWTREGLKPEGDGAKVFRNAVEFARRNLL